MNHFFWGSVLCAENKFAHKYLLVPNQLHFQFWHIKLARKAARLEPIIDFYQPIKPVLVNPTKYHLEHLLNQNRVCNGWILKSTQLNWSNSIKLKSIKKIKENIWWLGKRLLIINWLSHTSDKNRLLVWSKHWTLNKQQKSISEY